MVLVFAVADLIVLPLSLPCIILPVPNMHTCTPDQMLENTPTRMRRYTMTVVMLLASLCFHDYREGSMDSVGGLNAGTFAAVCLASRLGTNLHAFAFMWFALTVFKLWPDLRFIIKVGVHWCCRYIGHGRKT